MPGGSIPFNARCTDCVSPAAPLPKGFQNQRNRFRSATARGSERLEPVPEVTSCRQLNVEDSGL